MHSQVNNDKVFIIILDRRVEYFKALDRKSGALLYRISIFLYNGWKFNFNLKVFLKCDGAWKRLPPLNLRREQLNQIWCHADR